MKKLSKKIWTAASAIALLFLLPPVFSRASADPGLPQSPDSISNSNSALINTGYSLVKPKDIPNSVTIYRKDFNKGLFTNPLELVNGKLDGLLFYSADGNPGSDLEIRTNRNKTIFATNGPLLVVDGFPLYNSKLMTDPNEVESITFIKNGANAGYYGEQSANGVILINTMAASDEPEISYRTSLGISQVQHYCGVLSGDSFRDLLYNYYSDTLEVLNGLGPENTNWQKAISRTAFSMDHFLSMKGKLAGMPVGFSFGRRDYQGVILNSSLAGNSGSLYLNPSFLDGRLNLKFKFSGEINNRSIANQEYITQSVIYDPTQSLNYMPENQLEGLNPYFLIQNVNNSEVSGGYRAIFQADYHFKKLKGLSLNLNSGFSSYSSEYNSVLDTLSLGDYILSYWTDEKSSYVQSSHSINSYINWSKKVDVLDLSLSFLAGFDFSGSASILSDSSHSFSYYYFDPYTFYQQGLSGISQHAFYSKLSFSFKDRVFFEFNARQHAYSFFITEYNKAFFPSATIVWNAGKEKFIQTVPGISDLQLSASLGTSGNRYLSNPFTGNFDPEITHEKISNFNINLNAGFFNNRLDFSASYFENNGKDLYINLMVPFGGAYTYTILTNNASIRNRGTDLHLNLRPVMSPDIIWNISFAWTHIKSTTEFLAYDLDADIIYYNNSSQYYIYPQGSQVGSAPNSFFLYKQVYNQEGIPIEGLYPDEDSDGTYDLYSHDPSPNDMFSISSRLKIFNWEIALSGHAQKGNAVYNSWYANMYLDQNSMRGYFRNFPADFSDYNFISRQQLSDYFMEDASFFRMDYISFSHTFENFKRDRLSLDVSFIVQNAFTVTNYRGQDPEVIDGFSEITYPMARTGLIQLEVHF